MKTPIARARGAFLRGGKRPLAFWLDRAVALFAVWQLGGLLAWWWRGRYGLPYSPALACGAVMLGLSLYRRLFVLPRALRQAAREAWLIDRLTAPPPGNFYPALPGEQLPLWALGPLPPPPAALTTPGDFTPATQHYLSAQGYTLRQGTDWAPVDPPLTDAAAQRLLPPPPTRAQGRARAAGHLLLGTILLSCAPFATGWRLGLAIGLGLWLFALFGFWAKPKQQPLGPPPPQAKPHGHPHAHV